MIGRIVCAGNVPRTDILLARKALVRGAKPLRAPIVSVPGGFVIHTMDSWTAHRGWGSEGDFDLIDSRVREFYWYNLASDELFNKLKNNGVQLFTVGIDMYDSNGKVAETVVAHDLTEDTPLNDGLHITGKTFPRTDEEDKLVFAPVESHLVTVEDSRVLVLGCHDLNVWSGRSAANTTTRARKKVRTAMQQVVLNFRPHIVLHHAHATDSEKTWQAGWSGILKQHKLNQYATALGYYNEYGRKVEGFRSPLEKVQSAYNNGVLDSVLVF
jgi:hypothetical protein